VFPRPSHLYFLKIRVSVERAIDLAPTQVPIAGYLCYTTTNTAMHVLSRLL